MAGDEWRTYLTFVSVVEQITNYTKEIKCELEAKHLASSTINTRLDKITDEVAKLDKLCNGEELHRLRDELFVSETTIHDLNLKITSLRDEVMEYENDTWPSRAFAVERMYQLEAEVDRLNLRRDEMATVYERKIEETHEYYKLRIPCLPRDDLMVIRPDQYVCRLSGAFFERELQQMWSFFESTKKPLYLGFGAYRPRNGLYFETELSPVGRWSQRLVSLSMSAFGAESVTEVQMGFYVHVGDNVRAMMHVCIWPYTRDINDLIHAVMTYVYGKGTCPRYWSPASTLNRVEMNNLLCDRCVDIDIFTEPDFRSEETPQLTHPVDGRIFPSGI